MLILGPTGKKKESVHIRIPCVTSDETATHTGLSKKNTMYRLTEFKGLGLGLASVMAGLHGVAGGGGFSGWFSGTWPGGDFLVRTSHGGSEMCWSGWASVVLD